MNLSTLATVSILSLSLLSTFANAEDRQHSYGLVTGSASGEYKNSTQDGDGFAQAYLFYNYQAFENISVELAYNRAIELNSWECEEDNNDKWSCDNNNKPLFGLLAHEFTLEGFVFCHKGTGATFKKQ